MSDDEEVEGAAQDSGVERRSALVDLACHGERLDRCLVRLVPEFSRNHLQTLILAGHVSVRDAVVRTPARRVSAGDPLTVALVPTAQSTAFTPEPMSLQVVHENEHLLVIDKPVGLVVHPAPGHWSGTLLNGLLARDAKAALLPRAGIVHRLDKDTSGLMVVARTLEAMTALVRAIAAHDVQREYLAIVHGVLARCQATIEAPLGRDPVSRVRMAVVSGGKHARTDVTVLASRGDFSAVRCTLHTGRTHQIRVHLASIGHPLVADALYGGKPGLALKRQALHAVRLALAHPMSGQQMVFDCAPPQDFAQAWAQLFVGD